MIQETLKHLDELEAKATKGPWHTIEDDADSGCYDIAGPTEIDASIYSSRDGKYVIYEDAALIAELRNAYPSLREEILRLQGEVERLSECTKEDEYAACREGFNEDCTTKAIQECIETIKKL